MRSTISNMTFRDKGLFIPAVSLGYWLNRWLLIRNEFQTAMYNLGGDCRKGHRPPRRVVTNNCLGLGFYHKPESSLAHFLEIAVGVAVSNRAESTRKGALDFASVDDERLSLAVSVGERIRLFEVLFLRVYIGRDLLHVWQQMPEMRGRSCFRFGIGTDYQL